MVLILPFDAIAMQCMVLGYYGYSLHLSDIQRV